MQSLLQAVLAPLPADARKHNAAGRAPAGANGLYPGGDGATDRHPRRPAHRVCCWPGLIRQPDLLLLDEPGNHLDLPTLLANGSFLQTWQGASCWCHTTTLLDAVTNAGWILRDQTLHCFALPAALPVRHCGRTG